MEEGWKWFGVEAVKARNTPLYRRPSWAGLCLSIAPLATAARAYDGPCRSCHRQCSDVVPP
eukprot:5727623-Prymnesium_polylepis.1